MGIAILLDLGDWGFVGLLRCKCGGWKGREEDICCWGWLKRRGLNRFESEFLFGELAKKSRSQLRK